MIRKAAAVLLVLSALGASSEAESQDRLEKAKTLFFDRKYAEARQEWQAVAAGSSRADADAAAYYVARCSENLKEYGRAFEEYGAYLARKPADRALAEEARTSRVGLAARLYKSGHHETLSVLSDGVSDPSRTVRYYAALQLASLGPPVGLPAVPVLRRIVTEEKDDDLVERAKIGLLKLDPQALSGMVQPPAGPQKQATWIRIRIYEKGQDKPEVSVNLPIALADLVFKSLPDDAKRELKLKGYEAGNLWERLKKLGPTEILSVVGDDGERIQIWLE
jgi:hypothetical protein